MGHEYQDRVSLEMARIIAVRLPVHPEWLDLARTNLDNWTRRNHDAPRLPPRRLRLAEVERSGEDAYNGKQALPRLSFPGPVS